MEISVYEVIGIALMILLGNEVVATCCFKGTRYGFSRPAQWILSPQLGFLQSLLGW